MEVKLGRRGTPGPASELLKFVIKEVTLSDLF